MDTTNYSLTESESHIQSMTIETTTSQDLYSTTPLKITGSMYQRPNEDELHSSFDEAISDRVLAFNKQRRSNSNPRIDSVSSLPSIQTEASLPGSSADPKLLRHGTRDLILLVAVALMLLLIGFDVMGLLVLLTSP